MRESSPKPENDAYAIETRALSKRYGEVAALTDLHLRVPAGTIYGFLGPNGAGKTTAIRLLMGFARPTSGRARLLGRDAWADGVAARRDIGYLVPPDALYPDMTGAALLDFAAALAAGPPALRARFLDALELDRRALGRRLGTYSKGMRQKLALTAACQHDPALLVLDEPTDGLDPLIQRAFEELLRERRAAGRTVFFSSHDLAEVERTCERVAVVRAGRLVAEETVAGLTRRGLRTAEVVFAGPGPTDADLAAVPRLRPLGRDGHRLRLTIEGDPNPLLRFLAAHDVADLALAPPKLEDVFMAFYDTDTAPNGSPNSAVEQPAATRRAALTTSANGRSPSASATATISSHTTLPTAPTPPTVLSPGGASSGQPGGSAPGLPVPGAAATLRMTARLLRRAAPALASLLVLIALFELANPLAVDSLPGGAAGLESLFRSLPPALQALTKAQPQFIVVAGLAGYLSIGFTHPIYLTLMAVAVAGYCARALAGEIERGTVQIPLARPVSRPAVYGARVLGLAVVAALVALVGPLGLVAGLAIARPEGTFAYANLVPTGLACLLLAWAIGGLSLFGSAAAGTTGRAVAWATAFLVVSYVVDYFAQLWSVLQPIEPLSIYDYYDPAQALVNGALPLTNVLVLSTVGLAGTLAGLLVFARRDLPT